MEDIAFLIPILDELYSRTHIPAIIFNDKAEPLYPELSLSLVNELIDINMMRSCTCVQVIIEHMRVAYACMPFTIADKSYYLMSCCLLNHLDEDSQNDIPLKWQRYMSSSSIRSHIACEFLSAFYDYIKMLYGMITHTIIKDQDITTYYKNVMDAKDDDDDLTLRRLIQTTPEYYHWEQMFLESFTKGNINEVKSLISELHIYDIENSDLNDLESLKYKFAGFMTLLTRVSIQKGASFEPAFSLSDRYLKKLRNISDEDRLVLLLQEAIVQFHQLLTTYNTNSYSLNINRCIHYIDTHLYDKLSLHILAKHIHVNDSYLSALFKKETGTTMTAYIQKKKTEEAQRLLLFTNKSYSEIASLLNFNSQSAFIQVFKKFTNQTPKRFQENRK